MSSRLITDLHPVLQPLAIQFVYECHLQDVNAFITQTYRSSAEQEDDYAQGRTTPGHIVTNARAGQSPHNCIDANGNPAAKAFDFGIKNSDGSLNWNPSSKAWQTAIKIGENLGLVSGSTWHSIKDNPHLELPNWQSVV